MNQEEQELIATYESVEDVYGKKVITLIDKICEQTDKVLGDDGSLNLRDSLVQAVADSIDWD